MANLNPKGIKKRGKLSTKKIIIKMVEYSSENCNPLPTFISQYYPRSKQF